MTRTLLASCALISTSLLPTPSLAEDIYIALGEGLTANSQAVIDGVKSAYDAIGAGDKLTVLNAKDGDVVVIFDIANKPRYDRVSFKNKDYAAQLRTLQSFVRQVTRPNEDKTDLHGSDLFATMRTIGDLRVDKTDEAHVLIIADGLHDVPQNSSLSMRNDDGVVTIPNDGFLLGDNVISPYGRGTDRNSLENIVIHFCPSLPTVTTFEQDELGRFYAHNIALKSGVLSTFSTNVPSCVSRFKQRVNEPLNVRSLDSEINAAMVSADMSGSVTQVTITAIEDIQEKLDREKEVATQRIAELETENSSLGDENGVLKRRLRDESKARKDAEATLARYQKALGQGSKGEVTDFSKFTRVSHPHIPTLIIMTGVGYDDGFPDRYSSSWCYFNKENSKGANIRIDIGSKSQGSRIFWENASSTVLDDVSLSQGDFRAARQSCRFPAE